MARNAGGGGSAAVPPTTSSSSSAPAFILDNVPLLILKEPNAFATGQMFSSVVLSNKAEVVVHATRTGLSAGGAHVQVSYRSFGYVPSDCAASSNIINHVRNVPRAEVVLRDAAGNSRRYLRPEQKGVSLLQ